MVLGSSPSLRTFYNKSRLRNKAAFLCPVNWDENAVRLQALSLNAHPPLRATLAHHAEAEPIPVCVLFTINAAIEIRRLFLCPVNWDENAVRLQALSLNAHPPLRATLAHHAEAEPIPVCVLFTINAAIEIRRLFLCPVNWDENAVRLQALSLNAHPPLRATLAHHAEAEPIPVCVLFTIKAALEIRRLFCVQSTGTRTQFDCRSCEQCEKHASIHCALARIPCRGAANPNLRTTKKSHSMPSDSQTVKKPLRGFCTKPRVVGPTLGTCRNQTRSLKDFTLENDLARYASSSSVEI
ncbi:hypothetical protein [Rubritalea tangerina]|uniref:hypothetical protein n=1 Tax=Rubritalea tangerina TaxID=430798 RepID=UPI003617654C